MKANVLIDTTAAAVFAMSLMLAGAARADQPNGGGGLVLFQPVPPGEVIASVVSPTPSAFNIAVVGDQLAAKFYAENVCADMKVLTKAGQNYDYRVCSNGGIYRTIPTAR